MRCTLPLCQRNRKRAFLFQKSSLLAGAVGFEPTTKVLETHVWRACRPPGTEFHITPPNWSFKSDFQSHMNIIAEFLHLTRGHNKGPKDPRGKSCLFGMPSYTQKQSPSTRKSKSMGFTVDIQIGVLFSVLLLQICGHAAEEVFCAFNQLLRILDGTDVEILIIAAVANQRSIRN